MKKKASGVVADGVRTSLLSHDELRRVTAFFTLLIAIDQRVSNVQKEKGSRGSSKKAKAKFNHECIKGSHNTAGPVSLGSIAMSFVWSYQHDRYHCSSITNASVSYS